MCPDTQLPVGYVDDPPQLAQDPDALASTQSDLRQRKVLAAAKTWAGQLIDISGRNTLLYYKDLRQGTLDIGPDSGAVDLAVGDLLASRTVRLSVMFCDEPNLAAAARRARTICAKAQENYEERGLETLFLAWGMATWANPRGTATPAAPVLLRQAALRARGGAAEDFDFALVGDWELNPTLLHFLATEHHVAVDADDLVDLLDVEGLEVDPTPVFERLAKAANSVANFEITERIVCGNFSYAKLPMVHDIEAAADSGVGDQRKSRSTISGSRGGWPSWLLCLKASGASFPTHRGWPR